MSAIAQTNAAAATQFALLANGQTSSIVSNALDTEVTVYLGANATWGAGTLIIQESFDGGTTWVSHPSASWTAGAANTQLGKVTLDAPLWRFSLSGATSPSLLIAYKQEVNRFANSVGFSLTANGSTPTFTVPELANAVGSTSFDTPDNAMPWVAFGTWGSGTLALQVSPDGGTTWFNVDTATANIKKLTKPVTDTLFRFTLTGATAPSLTMFAVL